jgi:hypothetical protein
MIGHKGKVLWCSAISYETIANARVIDFDCCVVLRSVVGKCLDASRQQQKAKSIDQCISRRMSELAGDSIIPPEALGLFE